MNYNRYTMYGKYDSPAIKNILATRLTRFRLNYLQLKQNSKIEGSKLYFDAVETL
jgi:hypothetical protein